MQLLLGICSRLWIVEYHTAHSFARAASVTSTTTASSTASTSAFQLTVIEAGDNVKKSPQLVLIDAGAGHHRQSAIAVRVGV